MNGYDLISLHEHDQLVKLLQKNTDRKLMPEEEAVKYSAKILQNFEYEKYYTIVKMKELERKQKNINSMVK